MYRNNFCSFIGEIKSLSLVNDFTYYFDEIAVLYNLIGKKDNIQINSDGNSKFILSMNSEEDANKFVELLNGICYSVYNTKYRVNIFPIDNIRLNVEINKIGASG